MGVTNFEAKSFNSLFHKLKCYHDATSKAGGRGRYSGTKGTHIWETHKKRQSMNIIRCYQKRYPYNNGVVQQTVRGKVEMKLIQCVCKTP